MHPLLDDYLQNGTITTFEEFVNEYNENGTKGHDLEAYHPLLEYAKDHKDCIRVHAGFLPCSFARMIRREGPTVALENAAPYLTTLMETTMHKCYMEPIYIIIFFESLLSAQLPYAKQRRSNDSCSSTINNKSTSSYSNNSHTGYFKFCMYISIGWWQWYCQKFIVWTKSSLWSNLHGKITQRYCHGK